MINDGNIAWKTKRVFLQVNSFLGLKAADGISLADGGAPALADAPVAAAEIQALPMTTADEVYTVWMLPWDLDKDSVMKARLHYMTTAAAADGNIDWEIWLKGVSENEAISDAKSSADFNSAFALETVAATAGSYEITDSLEITAGTFSSTDKLALIAIELDSDGAADPDELCLLGLEIEYVIKACQDTHAQDIADS